MMKKCGLLIVIFLGLNNPLRAREQEQALSSTPFRGGHIYELNSERQKLLFTLKADLEEKKDGEKIFSSRYYDPQNTEAMTEVAYFKGFQLEKYLVEQKQIGESYEIKAENNKLIFSISRNGKIESRIRELPDNLIIGASFVPFIHNHWDELNTGKKILAELAVPEEMRCFTFSFEKVRSEKNKGELNVVLRMKPQNTLVSAVVRPVYISVNSDGSRILSIRGHMLPKLKNKSRWVDFDGEAVFQY